VNRQEAISTSGVYGRKLAGGLGALKLTSLCDERSNTMGETRTREHVREVLARCRNKLLASPGAVGAGVGKNSLDDEEYVIVVYLESEPGEDSETVVVEGVPVVFRTIGKINLQPNEGVDR